MFSSDLSLKPHFITCLTSSRDTEVSEFSLQQAIDLYYFHNILTLFLSIGGHTEIKKTNLQPTEDFRILSWFSQTLSIIILSYNMQKVSLLIIIDISFVKYNIVEYRLKTLEQTSNVLVDKPLSKIIPATARLKTIS